MGEEILKEPIDLSNLPKDLMEDKEVNWDERIKIFMENRTKIPKQMLIKQKRILSIESDSLLASRNCCPSRFRTFDAYLTSSNGIFEVARMERTSKLSEIFTPEILIYKTCFKYQNVNDHFSETLIGKIKLCCTLLGRKIEIYETTGEELSLKYTIHGSSSLSLAECFLPRS